MRIPPPLCLVCRHLRLGHSGRLACRGFPDGIPRALLEGRADHREPYPGDNGVRFQIDEDVPAEVVAELAVARPLAFAEWSPLTSQAVSTSPNSTGLRGRAFGPRASTAP
jgi:hypothetical protein